jgi:hypothetical protein
MQIGRREGERAKDQEAFEKHCEQNHARPRRAPHQARLRQEAARGSRRAVDPRRRLPPHFAPQQQAHGQIAQHQRGESPAPAYGIGEQAAQHLPQRHAKYGAGEKARQRGLAALVGHRIAYPGHGQGHDAGAGRARQGACHDQGFEGGSQRRGGAADGAKQRGHRDHAVFAVAVAQRAEEHLQQAVGHRESRGRIGRHAGGAAEIGRQSGQHGVADAKRACADEGRERQ